MVGYFRADGLTRRSSLASVILMFLARASLAQLSPGDVTMVTPAPIQTQTSASSGYGHLLLSTRSVVSLADVEGQFDATVTDSKGVAVTGAVTVTGVQGFEGGDLGDIHWRVQDGKLYGTVSSAGSPAYFQGAITADGASGTFSTPDGLVGAWTWRGTVNR